MHCPHAALAGSVPVPDASADPGYVTGAIPDFRSSQAAARTRRKVQCGSSKMVQQSAKKCNTTLIGLTDAYSKFSFALSALAYAEIDIRLYTYKVRSRKRSPEDFQVNGAAQKFRRHIRYICRHKSNTPVLVRIGRTFQRRYSWCANPAVSSYSVPSASRELSALTSVQLTGEKGKKTSVTVRFTHCGLYSSAV